MDSKQQPSVHYGHFGQLNTTAEALESSRPYLVRRNLQCFLDDESGQDMIEYVLILAFVGIAGAAAMLGMGNSVNTIWGIVNSRLAAANSSGS